MTSLTQRQLVTSSASAASDRSTVYAGVLLRAILALTGFGAATDRAARTGVVEAVATDGYMTTFNWGELFNSSLGDQTLVVLALGWPAAGSCRRPGGASRFGRHPAGPRHVRNLCALLVRR